MVSDPEPGLPAWSLASAEQKTSWSQSPTVMCFCFTACGWESASKPQHRGKNHPMIREGKPLKGKTHNSKEKLSSFNELQILATCFCLILFNSVTMGGLHLSSRGRAITRNSFFLLVFESCPQNDLVNITGLWQCDLIYPPFEFQF